ncbi:MAG: PH domain-containing protein [Lachnospiraceae bacterium]|nr:PH domain-containing protein [Lachnospiraceae bacterium]
MAYKEKKRIMFFGLPWTFTTYEIDEEGIVIDTGFFNKEENDCYMYKVQDVTLKRSLMERMFGLGTVICHTGDVTHKTLELIHIKRSKEVKDYILKASEEARLRRRTVSTLNIDADGDMDEDVD